MGWKQPIDTDIYLWFGDDHLVRDLFWHLIMKARNENMEHPEHYQGKLFQIKRGQTIFGRNKYSELLRCSPSGTLKALKRLEKVYSRVTSKSTTDFTIITILNYDELVYQGQAKEQAGDKLVTLLKSVKSVKSVKKDKDLFGTVEKTVPEPSNGKVLDEDINRILKPFPSLQLVRTNDIKNIEFWECYNGEHGLLWTYFKGDGDGAEAWLVRHLTEIDKWQRITQPQKASKSAAGLRKRITNWLGKEFDKLERR